jgi:hypothetical protein
MGRIELKNIHRGRVPVSVEFRPVFKRPRSSHYVAMKLMGVCQEDGHWTAKVATGKKGESAMYGSWP